MGGANVLDALFPGPRRFILTALFGEPDRWWSLTELAGRAGLQPGSVRPHVIHLRDGGVLREKHDDGRVWFQPDPGCPVYAELRCLLGKLVPRAEAGETILVVEDQPATAQITRILLESWGYKVLEAHCATEAIEVFDRTNGEIDLLLTDVIMPGMSGPQLAGELLKRRGDLRIVFMSGYPSDQIIDSDSSFLPKPFNPASLSRMIRKELDRTLPAIKPA